ncbi:hypothetical protein FDA94_33695 [Herbidospora galbida]|uniref:Uncharacterized protein n=1 Tax=Herbidospora galbida TaxID=2575442 RepID=A0A4V5UZT1_9ACTN|nr:hypothetical protein [Herbidospora galbida]TKK81223.1 hypothetical protein FDA94_33695 [Herbidospora galbida]
MNQLTRERLTAGIDRIQEAMQSFLELAKQLEGLPPDQYAAGQFLKSIDQRGVYGTTGALLTLARATPSALTVTQIRGLTNHLISRESAENRLAKTRGDKAALKPRLDNEARITFKAADLLYALAATPVWAEHGAELAGEVIGRIDAARIPVGGWGVELKQTCTVDMVATASVIRARTAARLPVAPQDVDLLRITARSPQENPHVRIYCLLALLEQPFVRDDDGALVEEFLATLDPFTRTEEDYKFEMARHHHWIHIPWQLYLLSCVALWRPGLFHTDVRVRAVLDDALTALESREGYIYPGRGGERSTRTYGILMDTLWRIRQVLGPPPPPVWTPRRVLKIASWSGLAVGGGFTAASLWWWAQGEEGPLGSVGGNVAAAALLAALSLLLGWVKKR